MKFLCLCYYDTDAFARITAEEAAKIEPACKPHDARLKASGKVTFVGSLAFPDDWVSVPASDTKKFHDACRIGGRPFD